jgi:hypothetical protein
MLIKIIKLSVEQSKVYPRLKIIKMMTVITQGLNLYVP